MRGLIIAIIFSIELLLGGCATPTPPVWQPLAPSELNHPLSLEECLTLARRNDLQAAQWQARLATARAELTTARTLPNPTFSASWEDLGIKDAAGTSLANSTYGISYPIFFWWTRGKEIAVARRKLHAEEEGVRADQRQLAIDIGTAYFTLVAAGRKARATDDLLREAHAALRLAEESFKLGSVAGHDVALARTEEQQARADLFDARQEAKAQGLALAFALGAARPLAVQVAETTLSLPLALTQTAITETSSTSEMIPKALLSQALSVDPSSAKARADREAAEAQYQLELRRIVPLSEAQAGAARKNAPEGMGHNLSFDIPIPLFNWNQGGLKKARAELLATRMGEEKARRETIAHLSEAWQAYVAAKQRHEGYSRQIAEARVRLAVDAQDLFAAGQIGYTELLQARREWRQTELSDVDSWRESMIAAWKILCQIGCMDRNNNVK